MQQLNTSNMNETNKPGEDGISHSLFINADEDTLPKSHAVSNWCVRLVRGARCRWQLNQNDASPLVHTLRNFGEFNAAVNACKQIIASNPENSYAYIHLIDLFIGQFKDFNKAKKYYQQGSSELKSADSRELLESFYLYMCCVHSPVRKLLSLLSHS